MQIDLPVPFGIKREGKVDAGYLPRQTLLDEAGVIAIGRLLSPLEAFDHLRRLAGIHGFVGPALLVVGALFGQIPRRRHVEFILHYGIPA